MAHAQAEAAIVEILLAVGVSELEVAQTLELMRARSWRPFPKPPKK